MTQASQLTREPRGRLPFRVLHVGKFYPPYRGGIESHLQTLCSALREVVEVEAVVSNVGRRAVREEIDGVQVTRVGTLARVAAASICPGMAREIRRAAPDVLHVHLPNPPAVVSSLASGHRGPLVVSYHSDVVRQKILGRAFEPLQQRFLERADAIVVASPDYLETSSALARFRSRCHVIPYGIPLEGFRTCDPAQVAEIRQKYGPRIVLSVGRLVYYKGFEYLIRGMAGVDARLLIIGDGPLRGQLEECARAAGVADRVVFLSGVDNLVPYYHAADVFALASVARSEAFGIVQLEAMAAQKPVVNTSLDSGVPFVSIDGVTGVTVPPADAGALCRALSNLLDDPTRRAQLGVAALRRVEREFSRERMVERILALYQEVMTAHAPRSSTLQEGLVSRSA